MKKLYFLLIVTILILVGCSKTVDESPGFKDGTIITDIFSNNNFITYATSYNYISGREYMLELSVNLPNEDGTLTKKILKESYFKAKDDTKILADGILIEDVKK